MLSMLAPESIFAKVVSLSVLLLFSGCDTRAEAAREPMGIAPEGLSLSPLWVKGFGYETGGYRVDAHPRALADVDGDGMADIIGIAGDGVYVARSLGSGFTEPERWLASLGYDAGWRVDKHPRLFGDIDGDGKVDIVGFGDRGVYVARSLGRGFLPPTLRIRAFGYDAGGWRVDEHPRLVADVNGDGMDDIVGFAGDGVLVSLATGNGCFSTPSKWSNSFGHDTEGWRVDKHLRLLVDVSGDKRADIVGFGDDGVLVARSTGDSFEEPSRWTYGFGHQNGFRVGEHPRVLADVDGDGRADIVGFGDDGVYISYSLGWSFTAPARKTDQFGAAQGWRADEHPRLVGDVDGDGRADIVGFGDHGVYAATSRGEELSPLTLLTDDFGCDQGGWRVDRHLRVLADVNGDGRADIVGFGDRGVYVKTN